MNSTYWRWTVPFNKAQTVLGALGKLQIRSREVNSRPHTRAQPREGLRGLKSLP